MLPHHLGRRWLSGGRKVVLRHCYADAMSSYQRRSLNLSPCTELSYGPGIDWKSIVLAQQPVLIRGVGSNWPAVDESHPRCWRYSTNLKQGPPTAPGIPLPVPVVSVEYGGNYMSTDMTLLSVAYADFIDYVFGDAAQGSDAVLPHIYLAQQEVGSVTPHLLGDIAAVPEITRCSARPAGDIEMLDRRGDNIYRVNIWISPGDIVSPVHTDPYQNLLCQAVGEKEVLLFGRDMSEHLVGFSDGMKTQSNTSCIDFESEDVQAVRRQYPGYDRLKGMRAVLSPGDGLFIPFKWWHYCKSLSSSVSVNYWWL